MEVRLATPQDCEAIARIHVQCWREVYSFIPEQVHQKRGYEFRLAQWRTVVAQNLKCEFLYVLTTGGLVVGFGFAKENQEAGIPAKGELHAGYVLPEHRGGISGPLLMREMVSALCTQGMMPISLCAFQKNRVRTWYRSLGWVPILRRNRVIEGQGVPELVYVQPDLDGLINRLDRIIARWERANGQVGAFGT